MTTEELDILWGRALRDSVAAGEMYTRYRFAALVAAAEREACATLAERATARKRTLHKMTNNLPELPPCAIAAAIRARGKQ